MVTAEHRNHARAFLTKAEEYLASARDNLTASRLTPAAGDAVHSGICAKDAMVTALTGSTAKKRDHAAAAKELRTALGKRPESAIAEKALRELISAKGAVEYGTTLVTQAKAELLVRRAGSLVDLATSIVRLGG